MPSEFLLIAERILAAEGKPLSPREIVDLAQGRGMFSDKVAGKTLHQTMWSKLSTHIRRHGEDSPFVRTAKGRYYLRPLLGETHKEYDSPALAPPPPAERVLVFPSTWLDAQGRFQGINTSWKRLLKSLLVPSVVISMGRFAAEQDNEHKQLLTYVIVTQDDHVLAYKRGTYNRVEDFLRGSQCIGFGGHVSENDLTLFDRENLGVIQCAARELAEELKLGAKDKERLDRLEGIQIVGLLNDDSSEIGRRHFAIVMQYEVSTDKVWDRPGRGEKSITQLRWLDPAESDFQLRNFEYWSQLCLRSYFPRLVRTQPSYMIRRRRPLRPPHVLCVLGEIGSGKTEATRVLKETCGYLEVNSGQVMARLLGIPPVPETPRGIFQAAAWEFISRPSGPQELARALWDEVETHTFPRLLIDGIRQRATLEALRQLARMRKIGVLFVHTPPDVAFEFYKSRAGDEATIHDFLREREQPVESEVRGLISMSDAVLYNWTGRASYVSTITKLMQEVERAGR